MATTSDEQAMTASEQEVWQTVQALSR